MADPDDCVAVLYVVCDAVNNEDLGGSVADEAPLPAAVVAGEVVAEAAVAEVDERCKGVLHSSRLLAIISSSSAGSLLQFPGRIHSS